MNDWYPTQLPSKERWRLEDGTELANIHPMAECNSRHSATLGCAFHGPSDHPLAKAELIWQNGRLWRVCEHGIAHPDHDALVWARSQGHKDPPHLCCSHFCCSLGPPQDKVSTQDSDAPTARRARRVRRVRPARPAPAEDHVVPSRRQIDDWDVSEISDQGWDDD